MEAIITQKMDSYIATFFELFYNLYSCKLKCFHPGEEETFGRYISDQKEIFQVTVKYLHWPYKKYRLDEVF